MEQAMQATNTVDPPRSPSSRRWPPSGGNPNGKFKPLHMLNPCRLDYITAQIAAEFDRDLSAGRALRRAAGPRHRLRRRAAVRTDGASRRRRSSAPTPRAQHPRRALHAEQSGLDIDYRHTTAEDLAAAGERFDVVLNMEVVEHVADPQGYLTACQHAPEARRADDLLDHQPQPEELRHGDRRRRIRHALAAEGHA
jgi:2-polyprenyl-6-hydroxyphenyl methylase / 3-demethylubiquinone-9 3-methyltransferase